MQFVFRKKGWDNCLTFFRELIMARIHDENETELVISEIKYTYEQYWKRERNFALRLEVYSDKRIKMYAVEWNLGLRYVLDPKSDIYMPYFYMKVVTSDGKNFCITVDV